MGRLGFSQTNKKKSEFYVILEMEEGGSCIIRLSKVGLGLTTPFLMVISYLICDLEIK